MKELYFPKLIKTSWNQNYKNVYLYCCFIWDFHLRNRFFHQQSRTIPQTVDGSKKNATKHSTTLQIIQKRIWSSIYWDGKQDMKPISMLSLIFQWQVWFRERRINFFWKCFQIRNSGLFFSPRNHFNLFFNQFFHYYLEL